MSSRIINLTQCSEIELFLIIEGGGALNFALEHEICDGIIPQTSQNHMKVNKIQANYRQLQQNALAQLRRFGIEPFVDRKIYYDQQIKGNPLLEKFFTAINDLEKKYPSNQYWEWYRRMKAQWVKIHTENPALCQYCTHADQCSRAKERAIEISQGNFSLLTDRKVILFREDFPEYQKAVSSMRVSRCKFFALPDHLTHLTHFTQTTFEDLTNPVHLQIIGQKRKKKKKK